MKIKQQVVTIHDTAFIHHPEYYSRKFAAWYRYLIPRLVQKVQGIITVSQFSKDCLQECFEIDQSRIHVVHNGIASYFYPRSEEEVEKTKHHYKLARPYLIYLGSMQSRINLPGLLKFADHLHHTHPDMEMVMVGTASDIFRRQQDLMIPQNTRFLGYVDDEYLPGLLTGASLMVFPSLYEGFGFPVLEAMACGTPVACSNTGSLPEIAGNAAAQFNPQRPEDIHEVVANLMQDPNRMRSMSAQGLNHAKQFTWKLCAEKTAEILRQCQS